MQDPKLVSEKILVDADLSILGADEPAFREYEARVRSEWWHVSDEDFRDGRLKVLDRFDKKPNIFSTRYARDRWEAKARLNIGTSMTKLRSGRWP
jgi:predicted metal-dependent HD superfamily phosphohydrolase